MHAWSLERDNSSFWSALLTSRAHPYLDILTAKGTNQFFYNIADKHACFFYWMQILTQCAAQKKKTNAYIGWLQTRHNRSSSLSEHSISRNASEILLIYSLTINGNWRETKVNDYMVPMKYALANSIKVKNCFKDCLEMWRLFLYSKYNGIVLPLHES